jgi:type I restriction enzyme M protein
LVEAIIALPTDMFYNTGIATYVWILSNKKPAFRQGKVQLIDASSFWQRMRKSLGSKRKQMNDEQIAEITQLFGLFAEANLAIGIGDDGKEVWREVVQDGGCTPPPRPGCEKVRILPISRIFDNKSFGYQTITVERPELDENGKPVLAQRGKAKGKPVADTSLRDTENVPLTEGIDAYFEREVKPHAPDAWVDKSKTKIGYEIPFNRHFYVFEPPRPLAEIDAELGEVSDRIRALLKDMAA